MSENNSPESPETPTDDVWIVLEDSVGEMARIRRVFATETAANAYVNDPKNMGHLFVKNEQVETEYAPAGDQQ